MMDSRSFQKNDRLGHSVKVFHFNVHNALANWYALSVSASICSSNAFVNSRKQIKWSNCCVSGSYANFWFIYILQLRLERKSEISSLLAQI